MTSPTNTKCVLIPQYTVMINDKSIFRKQSANILINDQSCLSFLKTKAKKMYNNDKNDSGDTQSGRTFTINR